MNRVFVISAVVFLLLLACGKQQKPVAEQPLPFTFDENLQQIDSLMQHDADSALMMLIDLSNEDDTLSFRAQRGTPSTFNANYQSLLISEALYKTYNPQLNRYRNETFQETSLHEAMQYFDSLYANYPKNDDLAMLSARSHYMNGVGFYENDSVVDACKEYLKTLEIMENHFEEKDLVGNKAKFMSLTYGRLYELFSDQFMPEPSIYCGKKSLNYCKIELTSRYGVANMLYRIGLQYDILKQSDTALYYYNLALENLPETNNLVYRDLIASTTILSYGIEQNAEKAISNLKQVINATDNIDEKTSRYLSLGYIYYNEKDYDSAIVCFDPVFNNSNSDLLRFQSAEYLRNIYLSFDNIEAANRYMEYIANHAASKYDNMMDVSILNDLFYNYIDRHQNKLIKPNKKRIVFTSILFIIVLSSVVGISKTRNKKKIISAGQKYKREKDKVSKLEKDLDRKRSETELKLAAFLNEPICMDINNMVCDVPVSSRYNYSDYPKIHLEENSITELGEAITKHFPNLKARLLSENTKLKKDDLLLCYLYLLGLKDQQIALLRKCHYTTIYRQVTRLKKSLGVKGDLSIFIKKIAVSST